MKIVYRCAVPCSLWLIAASLGRIYPALAGASNLEVKLNGLKNAQGQICLTLFSGPRGFPNGGKGASIKTAQCVPASSGGLITFKNVALGNYAIAAIHDRNSDGRMNTNRLGIPSEGFGFSNNPPLRFGPATYGESAFFVSGTKTTVKIQMRYLN